MTTDLPQDLPDRSPQPSPGATPPVPAAVRRVPDQGLEPNDQPPKRVLVIGAGLAGLVAAYELKRQGHDVVVLEAQNRVGGRVLTRCAPSRRASTPRRGRCASRARTG